MPRQSPFDIILTEHERATIEAMARRYTSSYREVVRARIVLYAADGQQNKDIAVRLDTSPQIVSKWRKRFFEQRLEGLDEAPRHGRPASFSPHNRDHHQGTGL
ncbi:MAG: helix-turn-helix domain-containing protein [Longimicrobiales bacterium]|nr:helix-turn-helix domain-containing protein [Longimicrobiales bacterium]